MLIAWSATPPPLSKVMQIVEVVSTLDLVRSRVSREVGPNLLQQEIMPTKPIIHIPHCKKLQFL